MNITRKNPKENLQNFSISVCEGCLSSYGPMHQRIRKKLQECCTFSPMHCRVVFKNGVVNIGEILYLSYLIQFNKKQNNLNFEKKLLKKIIFLVDIISLTSKGGKIVFCLDHTLSDNSLIFR